MPHGLRQRAYCVGCVALSGWLGLSPLPTQAELPAIKLAPLSVESTRTPTTVRVGDVAPETTTGAMSRIQGAQLRRGRETLGEVLEHQVGVDVRRSGGLGSLSTVSLRGADSEQVTVYLDGMPLNEAAGGGVNLADLELAEVEAIEVYRGFTPIQLGRGGVGGAINIRTHRTRSTDFLHGRVGYGSLDERKASVLGGLSHGAWDGLASVTGRGATNDFTLENNNGTPLNPDDDRSETRRNAEVVQGSGLFKLSHRFDEQRQLTGYFHVFHRDQGLPNWNNAPVSAELATTRYQTRLRYAQRRDAGSPWAFSAELYGARTIDRFDDREDEIGLGRQQTRDTTDTLAGALYAERPGRYQIPALRLDLRTERYRSDDRLSPEPEAANQRHDLALALQDTVVLWQDRFRVVPTLRLRYLQDEWDRDAAANGDPLTETVFSPSLGLRFDPHPVLTLRSQFGRYLRPPSFFELFGDRGLFLGNPDLKPERGTNWDVGIIARARPNWPGLQQIRSAVHYFDNRIDDAIVKAFDARGVGQSQNIGEARIRGWELSAGASFPWNTELAVHATLQAPENRSDQASQRGNRLPGRVASAYDIRLQQTLGDVELGYELAIEQGRFFDSANLLRAEDQTLHNLGVTYHRRHWHAGFHVRNLTDAVYEDFNGFPRPGRTFSGEIGFRWGKPTPSEGPNATDAP